MWPWSTCFATHRRSVAVAATVAAAIGTMVAVSIVRRRRRHSPFADNDDIVFVDHREATFSLWRRDVEDRLDVVERMLELLASELVLRCPVEDGGRGGSEAGDAPTSTAARMEPMLHQQQHEQDAAADKSILEADEQLTKIMIDIDGAPVSNLDHLRMARKSLMQRALALEARLAQVRGASAAHRRR